MKLVSIRKIEGKIALKTGLHIGAGSDEIHIGGIDTPVVKDPLTGWPYIPGSSLKGKIRTLLEWATNRVNSDGKPWSSEESHDPLVRIFGNGDTKMMKKYIGGPTRVSFSDCFLEKNKALEMINKNALTEEKTEVSIDRRKGTVGGGGPRRMERVPAGAEFNFEITYKVYDMGDGGKKDEENLDLLLAGMKLLELDALGGSGSRGYGKIEFKDVRVDGDENRWNEIDVKEVLDKFVREG